MLRTRGWIRWQCGLEANSHIIYIYIGIRYTPLGQTCFFLRHFQIDKPFQQNLASCLLVINVKEGDDN